MTQTIDDDLAAGRAALDRHAWHEAFDLLSRADEAGDLRPDDLERLGDAAWWASRGDRSIDARERAFAGYSRIGDRTRAAMMAVHLAKDYAMRNSPSVSAGWLAKGERLLEDEPESAAHGQLARQQARKALDEGRVDEAMALAEAALGIGMRVGDPDVQALALHLKGEALTARGQVAEGLALQDEATVAAVSGELSAMVTGIIYCNMISVCARLADYRRAGEWTEAAQRWCERQSISGFPGICRVHRAEIMRLRGAWADAEREARRACAELRDHGLLVYAADGFYELGEIRRRMGDLGAAEEAYRQAHELGHEPQPGLALVRLAEGKLEAAAAGINRAVADAPHEPLSRAKLLPAQARIAIAAGDLDTARSAIEEMESIADAFGTPALRAQALCARGELRLAEGDTDEARRSLRQSWRLWGEVDAPYEAAEVRMLLGMAQRAVEDAEGAELELRAARSAFERLGAAGDAFRVTELLAGEPLFAPLRGEGARATRTFMFTDIVRSTDLIGAIGDEAWTDLVRWHDETLRRLFAEYEGEEIDQAGDGFFAAFQRPDRALDCAVAIQRRLAEHRRLHGFAPHVRIGVHAAEAAAVGRSYKGKGVHEAARIGALAGGGEIVASRETLQAAGSRLPRIREWKAELKGVVEPVEVATLEWR